MNVRVFVNFLVSRLDEKEMNSRGYGSGEGSVSGSRDQWVKRCSSCSTLRYLKLNKKRAATNQFHLPQSFYLLFDPLFYIILLVLLSRSWTTNESINNLSTGHSQHSQHKCEVGHKTCTSVYGRKVFLYLVLRFAMFSSPYSRIAGIAYNGGPQNRILDFHRSIYGHF